MNNTNVVNAEQRHRSFLSAMKRLGEKASGNDMASEACLSRYHFQRVFRQSVGEAPGGLRRRLVLERAAFDLRNTEQSVTEIAFDAGYNSLEGFGRAFKAAFGQAPSVYRRATRAITRLPGTSGVHFDPARNAPQWEKTNMDLTDRMIWSDYHAKKRILECARTLTDIQLDAPLAFRNNLMPFVEPERTLREALARMAGGENGGWIGQMMQAAEWPLKSTGYRTEPSDSVAAMVARLDTFQADFVPFANHVKTNNLWDTEWVDDSCEQPETFSYGDVIESSLTWSIAQRMVVQRLLEQMGLQPDSVETK